MSLARAVLSLCLVITGQVMAEIGFADEIPLCARPIDPSTFTSKGTKVVFGAPNARLYLHSQHPAICTGNIGTSCPATTYIVTGDSVSTGEMCPGWTAVKYQGKKRDFYGWVESNRLVGGDMKDVVSLSLEEELATAYKAALDQPSSSAQEIESEQRQWLQVRDACAKSHQSCLEDIYRERLKELRAPIAKTLFDWRGFSAGAGGLDKPFVWSSPTAAAVWSSILPELPKTYGAAGPERMRERSMFVRIGPDSFLVMTSRIYWVRPGRNKIELLASARQDDEWDLPEFREIPGKGMWALLHADDLSSGINTNYFGAVFVKSSPTGDAEASFQDISTFQDVDDELCAESAAEDPQSSQSPEMTTAQHLDHFEIKDVNHDLIDDIVFDITEENCQTRETKSRKLIFVNTGSEFKALNTAEVSRTSP
jgi:hypothetical protein